MCRRGCTGPTRVHAQMQVRESQEKGIFVVGLSTFVVKGVADLMKVLKKGQKARKGARCGIKVHRRARVL